MSESARREVYTLTEKRLVQMELTPGSNYLVHVNEGSGHHAWEINFAMEELLDHDHERMDEAIQEGSDDD